MNEDLAMADTFGARLLLESKEESLSEVLRSLRRLNGVSPTTGLPSIDRDLDTLAHPLLPGNGLLGSAHAQDQHAEKELNATPVVEIAGASPCSGKTQLLYFLAVLSLYSGEVGGSGAVVWVDTDGTFDVLRLHAILVNHVNMNPRLASLETNPQDEAFFSLQHLHVYRPQSSASLLSTLQNLSPGLLIGSSGSRPLKMVILNSLSAFLWQDRQDSDSTEDSPYLQRYRDIVGALKTLQANFDCIIVASNWVLSPVHRSRDGLSARPHMPAVWNNFCTLKLLVTRKRANKFELGMSVEEALLEDHDYDIEHSVCRNIWTTGKPAATGGGFAFLVDEVSVSIRSSTDA